MFVNRLTMSLRLRRIIMITMAPMYRMPPRTMGTLQNRHRGIDQMTSGEAARIRLNLVLLCYRNAS